MTKYFTKRCSIAMAAVLLAGSAMSFGAFHYCSVKYVMGNPNHTCGDCKDAGFTLTYESFPGMPPDTVNVYSICDDNRDNPGGCVRGPHGGSGTQTPTCDINTSSGCGQGVSYSMWPDCMLVDDPDWKLNSEVYAQTGANPASTFCSGTKVSVTEGVTSGVDCSSASLEYFMN